MVDSMSQLFRTLITWSLSMMDVLNDGIYLIDISSLSLVLDYRTSTMDLYTSKVGQVYLYCVPLRCTLVPLLWDLLVSKVSGH